MGTDWREQISSIIADTNRNLGGRGLPLTHVPPLSFRSTRPVGLDTAFGEAMASSGTSAEGEHRELICRLVVACLDNRDLDELLCRRLGLF